ncbi:hypothetical protein DPX84_23860 [Salmonella enterica]|nr:hypothetical protein [Salmonella enterica]EBK8912768.1 hypothetical protein [Salmonella enterica]
MVVVLLGRERGYLFSFSLIANMQETHFFQLLICLGICMNSDHLSVHSTVLQKLAMRDMKAKLVQ